MSLNQDQEKALKQLTIFLAQPSKKDLILDAPAGCGKGYLLNYINANKHSIRDRIRIIDDSFDGAMYFTATTNEAVSGLPADAKTIYSFAGLRPKFPTGLMTTASKIMGNIIVFVDEASYIGKNAHYMIRSQLPNAKIVWVMDEFQLADVNEKKAYVTTLGFPKITMNQVMRNQGHIQQVSLQLREAVRNETYLDLRKFANGTEVELLKPNDFDAKIVDVYGKPIDAKYLSYTNLSVGQYNNAIHQRVFNQPSFPHAGAIGIINKYNDNINLRCGTKVLIHNTREVTHTLEKGTTITETYLETSKGTLITCADKVPYHEYNPNRYLYSDIVLPYGSTVHKAQGQSIDTVFIDLPNIESCRDLEMVRRLKYVGWSRAIEKIYLKDSYGN